MKKIFFVATTFIFVMLFGLQVNAGYDVTPPKLNSVTLDKTTVTKPGILNITLDITEEETGVTWIEILCEASDNSSEILAYINIPNTYTGKYTVAAPISSSFKVGYHSITRIRLWDAQGNVSFYYDVNGDKKLGLYADFESEEEFCYVDGFSVEEEFDVNFQYNITNPNIISKIKSMGNDEIGMITYNASNHVANKEIFEVMKGTNKTIVFSNDSMQWVFNGKDLTGDIKDIDLDIAVSETNGSAFSNKKNVLKIDFADNGTLPGKARIRLKSDYMYTLHNLSDSLLLYYIDDKNSKIEKINTDVNYILDGSDHWCQFYIDHNSSYIISSETAKYIPKKGAVLNDTKTKAQYTVIKSGKSNGTVEYKKSANSSAAAVSIPATVTINGITYKVTSVAPNAFKNNKRITKVTVGKNVNTIGASAFYGCSKLKNIIFKSGSELTAINSKAFYKCTVLIKITIPSKVAKIGTQAFYGCKKLKTIIIKTTKLTGAKIGSKALKGISSKATIKVPKKRLSSYKKVLKAKGVGSDVKIKN